MMVLAAIIAVTNPTELLAAIDNATAGDEIVLADGTYALTANVTCDAVGTAAEPIVVRAATPLGAKITINALEGFKVEGAEWHFEGLDITGGCASNADSSCEHAFHVYGAAHGFVLRGSRVRDFNAQLKVNASDVDGTMIEPNNGLIEYNEIGDTRARNTSAPVTKLNIDSGQDWIVRGNYLHDAQKNGGNGISYVAFMKSGGKRGLYERNLVICSRETTGGTRIGLSFGGGGTGNAFCAPAFDPAVDCAVEHYDGTMRNNIIVNCSDVGIYLNESANTHILYNTLVGTTGIDFRFATTTGEAVGNVMTSVPRVRDGGMMTATDNLTGVEVSQFASWYTAPLEGDFSVLGDVSSLIGAGPMRTDVPNDYCAATRPSGALTLGAIEHSVAAGCQTMTPPIDTDPPVTGGDDFPVPPATDSGGCCQAPSRPATSALLLVGLVALALRRRSSRARR